MRGLPRNIHATIGIPIYYHRCLSCGFIFTVAFDAWSFDDFRQNIYNDGYAAADPDYADGSRARANAALTDKVMGQLGARRVLDYGGGDGTMATELRAKGLDAHSWDPVVDQKREVRRRGRSLRSCDGLRGF